MEMTLVNLAVINFLLDAWQHLQRQHGDAVESQKAQGRRIDAVRFVFVPV